jgi:Spy/CpxP family protein refolding chaperone
MNGLSQWKVALYLAAIFCAGGVSGWFLAAKATKQKMFGPPPRAKEVATSWRDHLHARLNLTPDQARKIDAIIEQTSNEMESSYDAHVKCIRQVVSSRNAQIMAILTPQQRRQFEALEKERQETWRAKSKRGDWRRGSRDRGGTNAWTTGPQQRSPSSTTRAR